MEPLHQPILYFYGPSQPVVMLQGPILQLCPACRGVTPPARLYRGGRYGYVGSFDCTHCGAAVTILDRDSQPPIEYVADHPQTGEKMRQQVHYETIYRVGGGDFERLEGWLGQRITPQRGQAPFIPLLQRLGLQVKRHDWERLPFHSPPPFTAQIPQPFAEWLELYAAAERNRPHD
ncbi:hypothetical protein GCM10017783_24560 [Deinococcus piscis]|uniref:Uncharacterized protein n=1 Tax=Deinococcus piscis TaxID=394230 RepID=A0ABQ3KHQ6_9DEIO|nr:hypothetical protein GCM10017783_24560 [Deinococcus piscis]